jgi:soluble lytic murein transglycosylase-like protein
MIGYFTEYKYVQKEYIYLDGTGGENYPPVSLKMYEIIEELSSKYNIPKHIAYNVAYMETRYKGPFDWKYNPYLTSYAGAEGPMQIMPTTANGIHKSKIDIKTLRTDLRLNIETSMKLLRRLYDKYGNWSLVCGYYNTGRPIINNYALFCSNNSDYLKNWVLP